MSYKMHKLKTHPEVFYDAIRGLKTFEFRKNDRDFETGDSIILQEWNPDKGEYTGNESEVYDVSYCLYGGNYGIPDGYVVMSITE